MSILDEVLIASSEAPPRREWSSFQTLRPDLMPAFYARSPEQIQQESNLTYVAITRAKQDLTWGERRS